MLTAVSRATADPRVWIYAACDLLFAVVYAVVFTRLVPAYRAGPMLFCWALVVVVAIMGVGMLVRGKWGWRLAVGACGTMLALELLLLVLMITAAAFLAGVYGSFGRGGAGMTVLIALLSFEVIALLPALQLKFLLTRAGRRAFGK
jgi:hypothetical protein